MSRPNEISPMHRSGSVSIALPSAIVLALVAGAAFFYLNRERKDTVSSSPPVELPNFGVTQSKAESGDLEAQNSLGEIYAQGKQVRLDYAAAAQWYRKAAEKGLAKAQYNLAVLCDIGQGIPKNETEAADWYRKAAEQGNTDAQYTLAGMYGIGRGVLRDPKEALKWYHLAAEQGDALARFNLAERYERGKDVAQDLVEAHKWHSLAAERGLPDAVTARDSLQRKLNAEQLADSRKRIRDFKSSQAQRKPNQ